eukprot:UN32418
MERTYETDKFLPLRVDYYNQLDKNLLKIMKTHNYFEVTNKHLIDIIMDYIVDEIFTIEEEEQLELISKSLNRPGIELDEKLDDMNSLCIKHNLKCVVKSDLLMHFQKEIDLFCSVVLKSLYLKTVVFSFVIWRLEKKQFE